MNAQWLLTMIRNPLIIGIIITLIMSIKLSWSYCFHFFILYNFLVFTNKLVKLVLDNNILSRKYKGIPLFITLSSLIATIGISMMFIKHVSKAVKYVISTFLICFITLCYILFASDDTFSKSYFLEIFGKPVRNIISFFSEKKTGRIIWMLLTAIYANYAFNIQYAAK